MPFKKHKPEEVIGKLREVEIVLAQSASTAAGDTAVQRLVPVHNAGDGEFVLPSERHAGRAWRGFWVMAAISDEMT